MAIPSIPVNRVAVGLIAVSCFAAAVILLVITTAAPESSMLVLWQGGFVRVGLLMGAFWLALPSRNREAAWANLSPRTIGGFVLAFILMIKIPLRILIPAALVMGAAFLLLRPRPKKRPSGSVVSP
jgi:hypothetical protein